MRSTRTRVLFLCGNVAHTCHPVPLVIETTSPSPSMASRASSALVPTRRGGRHDQRMATQSLGRRIHEWAAGRYPDADRYGVEHGASGRLCGRTHTSAALRLAAHGAGVVSG